MNISDSTGYSWKFMTAGSTKTARKKGGGIKNRTNNAKSHGIPWLHSVEVCAGSKTQAPIHDQPAASLGKRRAATSKSGVNFEHSRRIRHEVPACKPWRPDFLSSRHTHRLNRG